MESGGPDDAEEEFDKPETVESIAAVLRGLGHSVELLGDGPSMLRRILDHPPDFVFNFAEGTGVSRSREARVPAVLEMLGIPYSGSDPLALAVTLDKDCCKRLVQSVGVRTPKWIVVDAQSPSARSRLDAGEPVVERCEIKPVTLTDGVEKRLRSAGIEYPVIVKPAYEGSSKGIRAKCLVESAPQLGPLVADLLGAYRQPVLVEEFIIGDEVTVGMVGNDPARVIGAMRILPQAATDRFIYSLEVKRDFERRVRYEVPARLEPAVLDRIGCAASAAYDVLGCRDVSRLDFRVRDGEAYLLEVNPLPGLNPETGDLVLLARGMGVEHFELVSMIFSASCSRYGLESRSKTSNPSNIGA